MVTRIKRILNRIYNVAYEKQVGHVGPSVSLAKILWMLYEADEGLKKGKGTVIVSKGHAALGYYAVLEEYGVIPSEFLENFCAEGSEVYGHINASICSHNLVSAGSLGNGLAAAVGYALASPGENVYCIVGDGEMEEGIVYEALRFAGLNCINNLTVIVDKNEYKGMGKTMMTSQIGGIFRIFDFSCIETTLYQKSMSKNLTIFSHFLTTKEMMKKPFGFIVCGEKGLDDKGNDAHYAKIDADMLKTKTEYIEKLL